MARPCARSRDLSRARSRGLPAAMAARAHGGEARAGEAHMGPLRLPNGSGTLAAANRDTIWQQFQVSASVRWRAQWGERCLSLSGPPRQLEDAKNMALQMIATHGTEGGRAAPGPTQQEFQQLERQAAAMQQQLTHQQGVLQWLQVQLQKAEQNAAAAYHESIKAKDEAEAAKDEAKKAISDMGQHMARRRRKRKHHHSTPKVGRGRSHASNQDRVPLQSVRREREASPIGSDSGQNGKSASSEQGGPPPGLPGLQPKVKPRKRDPSPTSPADTGDGEDAVEAPVAKVPCKDEPSASSEDSDSDVSWC